MLADPREIIKFVSLMPHHSVADFGAGSGAYTDALMDRIGMEGQVYALDALPQSIEQIRRAAKKNGKNVMTICTEFETSLLFKENLLDVAVLANTLHAIDPYARPRFLGELARVVKPKGEVLMVDWAGSFNNMGPARSMVIAPADAARLFRAAGFSVPGMLPAGTHHYAFVATNS